LAQAICKWTRLRAALGAGDDVFSTDEFSKRDDAIGYELRKLDESVTWLMTLGIRTFPFECVVATASNPILNFLLTAECHWS
jgi:hypothetical protein